MAKPLKTWQYAPGKARGVVAPQAEKADLEAKARRIIDEVLKPKYIEPPPADDRFNYITDLYGRWHGRYFHFIARYNSPGSDSPSPFFETMFARMEYTHAGHYNLAFQRYTGQWIELFQDQSVEECLDTIRDNVLFHP